MSFIRSLIHLLWMSITVIPYTLLILLVRLFGGSPAARRRRAGRLRVPGSSSALTAQAGSAA